LDLAVWTGQERVKILDRRKEGRAREDEGEKETGLMQVRERKTG